MAHFDSEAASIHHAQEGEDEKDAAQRFAVHVWKVRGGRLPPQIEVEISGQRWMVHVDIVAHATRKR